MLYAMLFVILITCISVSDGNEDSADTGDTIKHIQCTSLIVLRPDMLLRCCIGNDDKMLFYIKSTIINHKLLQLHISGKFPLFHYM